MSFFKDYLEKSFSKYIERHVVNYSKKYGFDMENNSTHNNEADAFKHTFMQALLALHTSQNIAKSLGDMHERDGNLNKQPKGEELMDLHNNSQGREIANEIINKYGKWIKSPSFIDFTLDIIAEKVWERMKQGKIILDPSGRRTLKNSGKSGVSTGQAVNLSEEEREMLERYARENEMFAPENRVFYENEMNPAQVPSNSSENNYVQAFVKQYLNNNKKLPTENELKQRVISGELVYVHNYERQDGTKVSGYYRSKPSR